MIGLWVCVLVCLYAKRAFWFLVFVQTLIQDDQITGGRQAIDLYFIQDDGGMFKSTMSFEPYFFVGCKVRTLIFCPSDLIVS